MVDGDSGKPEVDNGHRRNDSREPLCEAKDKELSANHPYFGSHL